CKPSEELAEKTEYISANSKSKGTNAESKLETNDCLSADFYNAIIFDENTYSEEEQIKGVYFKKGLNKGSIDDADMMSMKRVRRGASLKAEQKLIKQTHLEKKKDEKEAIENEEVAIFCKLEKTKRRRAEPPSTLLGEVLKNEANKENINTRSTQSKKSTPFIPHKVFGDITNSPVKRCSIAVPNKRPSSKFFLEDLDLQANIDSSSEDICSAFQSTESDKESISSAASPLKKKKESYIKLKEKNTKANYGYKTVAVKRKCIIELAPGERFFKRAPSQNRRVLFDLNNCISVHNGDKNNVKSILVDDSKREIFEWAQAKEEIEIIRRVNLGSDASVDDFVFRKVDNLAEM
ncbi:hypothetical protein ENBRE01_1876, partial [Enteropsectra breve]